MTSRSKSAVRGFETEIEKCREEGNWKRAVELATQLKARSPHHEPLANFLIGEGELEEYLEVQSTARVFTPAPQLDSAKCWLERATDDEGRKAGVALDAHLLLGKLHYARGDCVLALHHYDRAELSTLTEKELPNRSLRIVAESFAIRALCLEESACIGAAPAAAAAGAGVTAEAAHCVEMAAALGALWAQRSQQRAAGAVLLPALTAAAPRLHVRAHNTQRAIESCRSLLRATEAPATSSLRPAVARQLAELLLRSPLSYRPPTDAAATNAAHGPWRPRRYTAPNQFIPNTPQEELLLVLLLAEAMAARDGVLSQSSEFTAAREHALRSAAAIVDLLTPLAVRWRPLCLVQEALDRAMKFSFGNRHVWRQRALVTVASAPHTDINTAHSHAHIDNGTGGVVWEMRVRAETVLCRACALCPADAALALVAARNALHMGRPQRAAQWAHTAKQQEGPLQARAHLMEGIALQSVALHAGSRTERTCVDRDALDALLTAVRLDDNDHVALYHLALQLARMGDLNAAMEACRACLMARADCSGGLKLCAALWSVAGCGARGRQRALHAARLHRDQYGASSWTLTALTALVGAEHAQALRAGRELVALLATPHHHELLNECAVSVSAESTCSDALASSASECRALAVRRADAWLALAELLLRLDRAPAAAGAVAEAQALTPNNYRVFYTRGRVQAAMGDWESARLSFTDALALNPSDPDIHTQLGGAMYSLGWCRLAEGTLRTALCASRAVNTHDAWYRLANVLHELDEPAAAADAAAAALAALPTHPALPLPLPM